MYVMIIIVQRIHLIHTYVTKTTPYDDAALQSAMAAAGGYDGRYLQFIYAIRTYLHTYIQGLREDRYGYATKGQWECGKLF